MESLHTAALHRLAGRMRAVPICDEFFERCGLLLGDPFLVGRPISLPLDFVLVDPLTVGWGGFRV